MRRTCRLCALIGYVYRQHCAGGLTDYVAAAGTDDCSERCNFGGSGVPSNFFSRAGVQQIQLRTEDRQNGDLGAVAP